MFVAADLSNQEFLALLLVSTSSPFLPLFILIFLLIDRFLSCFKHIVQIFADLVVCTKVRARKFIGLVVDFDTLVVLEKGLKSNSKKNINVQGFLLT